MSFRNCTALSLVLVAPDTRATSWTSTELRLTETLFSFFFSTLAHRWPSFKRDSTWRTLLDNGVDWINADNLQAASKL